MNQEWIKAKVINRQMLTDNVLELTIETYTEAYVIPGQWAMFLFEDDQGPFQRVYSIVDQDTDNEKTMLIFAIKLSDTGRWATAIKKIHIADEITISRISGHFVLQDTLLPKVFIWTGVGIVPLINMAKYCTTKKQLLFSVSTKKDLFYEERIKKIHGLNYEIHLSQESLPWYTTWRIDISTMLFDPATEFYVCWKPEVIDDIIKKLTHLWYMHVYFERF